MIPPPQILQLLKENPDGVLSLRDCSGSWDLSHSDQPELWEIVLNKIPDSFLLTELITFDLAPNWELHFKVLKITNRQKYSVYQLIRIK